MQAVVDESDWLGLCSAESVSSSRLRHDSTGELCQLSAGAGRGCSIRTVSGSVRGSCTGPRAGRLAARDRGAAGRRRQRVLDVVVVIVEAFAETVDTAIETVFGTGPYPHPPGRRVRSCPRRVPAHRPPARRSADQEKCRRDPEQRDERRKQHRLRHRRGERLAQERRQLQRHPPPPGGPERRRRASAAIPSVIREVMNEAMPALPNTAPT